MYSKLEIIGFFVLIVQNKFTVAMGLFSLDMLFLQYRLNDTLKGSFTLFFFVIYACKCTQPRWNFSLPYGDIKINGLFWECTSGGDVELWMYQVDQWTDSTLKTFQWM